MIRRLAVTVLAVAVVAVPSQAQVSGDSVRVAAPDSIKLAAPDSIAVQAAPPKAPEPTNEPRPGRGGIGGQAGVSAMPGSEDYSAGASPRFSFSGHWRYQFSRSWRLQVSPGFLWVAYTEEEAAPFTDINFPSDTTKRDYITLMVPISAQIQYVGYSGPWVYYIGAGPGLHRVWVENHRKVLRDPQSLVLHRGLYLGASAQIGVERFLKSLPTTSIEVSWDIHWADATRDDQFPSGYNSSVIATGIRVGGNYYFDPGADEKKKPAELPGSRKP